MKLILAIVDDDDASAVTDALISRGFSATKLASTGGFLLRGNSTFMLGVPDDRVAEALTVIGRVCVRRRRLLPQTSAEIPSSISLPIEVEVGGATIFVLAIEEFHKI